MWFMHVPHAFPDLTPTTHQAFHHLKPEKKKAKKRVTKLGAGHKGSLNLK